MPHDLAAITGAFAIHGQFLSAAPYGSGHINDTYAVVVDQAGTRVRYIVQRINPHVFRDPIALMENIQRVTDHQHRKLADSEDASRRALTLLPARTGQAFHQDAEGSTWRAYLFIEHATTYDRINSPDQAREGARAFGEFQRLLVDLPGAPLTETIAGFHDTPSRYATLLAAIDDDPRNRAATVREEIAFAQAREADTRVLMGLLQEGAIPLVTTHNDTKLNNVMLDDESGKGICVIDLDTVMPGLALYDFGDMVRSGTNAAREDEQDLARVEMQMPIFEALASGYLSSAGAFLSAQERALLPFAGKLMSLECGIRFLTDYLQGDLYFKTHRPGQNLDRCRNQFKLVQSIESRLEAMSSVVACHGPS